MTEERSAGELLDEARRWWTTSIIDIHPGEIAVRGYPIEQLIGNVTFPQMIWLMLMGELPTEPQATLLEAARRPPPSRSRAWRPPVAPA